jgi:hypothetical protein
MIEQTEAGMDEPQTCGEGLAQRADLPTRLSALMAAMVDVLEAHEHALDLTDENARMEHAAYEQLIDDYRGLSSALRTTAAHMLGCRDLPAARHHAEAMLASENRRALSNLVERERVLAAFLKMWFEEDQALLAVDSQRR